MSQEHFSRIADEEGWSETTQITVLLRYIENQHSPEAFSDFLEGQRAESPAYRFLWDLAAALQQSTLVHCADFQEFCANMHDMMTIEQAVESWRLSPRGATPLHSSRAITLPDR